MYTTITVLTDGSLESEEDFEVATPEGEAAFRQALRDIEADSHPDNCNCLVQVYLLNHNHDPLEGDEECACIQYVQDHHAAFTYNQED